MQLKGDLEIDWIMFDDVKHVEGWTTLICHVHDFFYYKVMMFTICYIQFEDTKA
jgi:hypothetical protein